MERDYNIEKRHVNDLARAYVPFQVMGQVYSPREALKKGTLFPELYRPYVKKDKIDMGGRYNG